MRTNGHNSNPWSPVIRMRVAPKWTHGHRVSLGVAAGYRLTAFERRYRYCNQSWDLILFSGYVCSDFSGDRSFTYNEETVQKQLALSLETWNRTERFGQELQLGVQHIRVDQYNVPEDGFPTGVHPLPRYEPRAPGNHYRVYAYWALKIKMMSEPIRKLPMSD